MTVEKTELYNWIKVMVTSMTFLFQLILLFSSQSLGSYLLSNFSILGGYFLDLLAVKQNEKEMHIYRLIQVGLILLSVSLVFVLGDMLLLCEFAEQQLSTVSLLWHCSQTVIPALSVFALAFYTFICVVLLIICSRNRNCFIN